MFQGSSWGKPVAYLVKALGR